MKAGPRRTGSRHCRRRPGRRLADRCAWSSSGRSSSASSSSNPLHRGDARLEQVDHRSNLGYRLGELAGVLDEGLDVPEAHGPRGGAEPAQHRDHHIVEVSDEHHDRHDQPGEELGAEARLVQLLVLGLERGLDLALPPEDLDQGVAGESLLDLGVESRSAATGR